MSFIGGRLPKIKEEDKEKDDGEIGTQHLDALGDWFSGTKYGQRYIEGQERNAELQQELMAQPGVFGWMHRMQNTPNETEQKILENINKLSPVDERITTPATYLAIGALGGKGVPKLYNKLNKSPAAHRIAHEAGQNVGRNVTRIKKDVGWAKDQFQYATGQKLRPMRKQPNIYTDIEQVFEGSPSYLRRANNIWKHHEGGISRRKAMEIAKRLPEGKGPYDPKVYLSPKEVEELGLNKPLQMTLDPNGLQNWGRDKRKSGARFSTGKTIQDESKFIQAGWNVFAGISSKFGIDINRATSPLQIHHKGVVRQIAESLNGLTEEAAVEGGNIISEKVGFNLGYDETNAAPVPAKFHQRVHDIINDHISLRWGDNLKGLEQKLNLPSDWKTTMDLQARIDAGIYDEIALGINESTAAIDTFWKSVQTRTNLGNLTEDEFLDATLEVVELDKKLSILPRTRHLSPEEGYTATQAVNEILERAGRIDLQSPIFDNLTPGMSKDLVKILIQRNGQKALQEVLTTGQTPETIFKAYGIETKGYDALFNQLNLPGFTDIKDPTAGKPLGRPKGSKDTKPRRKKSDKPNQGEITVEWNKREYDKMIENLKSILDQELPD